MKEYLDSAYVTNTIRLMRSDYKGAFLIVEGSTDKKLYRNFTDDTTCKIIVANGKDNVVKAIKIVANDPVGGVLGIIDADFLRLDEVTYDSPHLLMTDYHDLEIMMIQSPALNKILGEYGSEEKLMQFCSDAGQTVASYLRDIGANLGYLRWISLINGLALRFEELSFRGFIDRDSLKIDPLKMVREVKNHSNKPGLDERELNVMISDLKQRGLDPWEVSCGHDLICILSIGLCKRWGSCNTNEVNPDLLEKSLRLAYEFAFFRETALYQEILRWEGNNQPYKVIVNIC